MWLTGWFIQRHTINAQFIKFCSASCNGTSCFVRLRPNCFKMVKNKIMHLLQHWVMLWSASLTLPIVNAYINNLFKTNSRSSLERDTITDCLYVRINMSPLVEFDPRPAVLHWLTDKKRRQKKNTKGDLTRLVSPCRCLITVIKSQIFSQSSCQKMLM